MILVDTQDFLENLIDISANSKTSDGYRFGQEYKQEFTNRRINAKFLQLAERYKQFTSSDEIFSEMVCVITELVANKEHIQIAKTQRKDEISWLITTVEKRMWDYIQANYTMNFIERDGTKTKVQNHFVYYDKDGIPISSNLINLDGCTYLGNDNFITNAEIYEIGNDNPTEYEELIGLRNLDSLMNDCNLTTSQKDIVLALERTRDTKHGHYNITEASELLGKERANVSRSWKTIQNKIHTKLSKDFEETQQDKFQNKIDNMCGEIETKADMLEWIKNNLNDSNINYIFYNMESNDRRRIIRAINENPASYLYYSQQVMRFLENLHEYSKK